MTAVSFVLPPGLNAAAPPERRGLRRDHVRLMVVDRRTGQVTHSRFARLGEFLAPGDLLVLNNSRTIPAMLHAAVNGGRAVEVRLAGRLGGPIWQALLVNDGAARPGDRLSFGSGLEAELLEQGHPLWTLRFNRDGADLYDALYRLGEPIRYEYLTEPWQLEYFQTVFASVPGSVEMPSAGRAFSWELLSGLRRQGVGVAFLSLHAGLSYYLDNFRKDPRTAPEAYAIPPATDAAIKHAREMGGRVIAVGTTVVRALESAARAETRPGWASVFVDRRFPLQSVDGLLTGLHEPEASHLDMLSAFIDPDLLTAAYREAIDQGYLWHEFGDTNLIL